MPWIQETISCSHDKECVPSDQCTTYVSDTEKLKTLRKGTEQHNILLSKLRSLICNKAEKKICCSRRSIGECMMVHIQGFPEKVAQ